MVSKTVIICTIAFMVQAISGQKGYKASSSSSSSGCKSISISSSGGDLLVSTVGPISPSGIAVATDLGLAGDLELSGALPYLSAVEFEGKFDTKGSAGVSYGCGDCVAITEVIGNANVNSGSSKIKSGGSGKLY